SIGFKLRAFNVFVATSQHRLGLLTGMLNATTLIMGFVALTGVRRSAPVDRRLVLCGYSRAGLITGRFAALAVASTLVAACAIADRVAWWQFWGSLGWAVGLGILGLLGFWHRTRIARPHA